MDNTSKCPICKSPGYKYESYVEAPWGVVEQHGICEKCGFRIEQTYSEEHCFFTDTAKGGKNHYSGIYYPKNIKKHKRYRRIVKNMGIDITKIPVNPPYAAYI